MLGRGFKTLDSMRLTVNVARTIEIVSVQKFISADVPLNPFSTVDVSPVVIGTQISFSFFVLECQYFKKVRLRTFSRWLTMCPFMTELYYKNNQLIQHIKLAGEFSDDYKLRNSICRLTKCIMTKNFQTHQSPLLWKMCLISLAHNHLIDGPRRKRLEQFLLFNV